MRISTMPSVARPGSFVLVLDAGFMAANQIFVLPNYYREREHLAWVLRWDGEKHHSSNLSPALTDRVLLHALGGLDFAS